MYLHVLDGPASGTSLQLDRPRTIGRDPDCDLVLDADERVSRRHAELRPGPDGTVTVTDLGSTNGVLVDGTRITAPTDVRSGATVRIGRTVIGVRATDPARPGGAATVIGSTSVVPAPPVSPSPAAALAPPAASSAPSAPGQRRATSAVEGHVDRRRRSRPGARRRRDDDTRSSAAATTRSRRSTPSRSRRSSAAGCCRCRPRSTASARAPAPRWVYDAADGFLVTNHHVVNSGTRFTVGTGGRRRSATLVGAAPCDDLAVLRVDSVDDLLQLDLGSQSDITNGDDVVALGYPGTASDTPTLITSSGVVSAPRTSFDADALDVPRYPNVVLTQTPINPGSSGGPLLDTRGRVVGVNSAGSLVTQNQNYAVGVDRVREVVPGLAAGDSLGWNGLVLVFPQSPEEVTALGYDPDVLFGRAVFAIDAVPQSPAANTGIFRQLDGQPIPIIGVDGVPMDGTLQGYCDVAAGKRRGQTSRFEVTDGTDVFSIEIGFA